MSSREQEKNTQEQQISLKIDIMIYLYSSKTCIYVWLLWCPNTHAIAGSVSVGFAKKWFRCLSGYDLKQQWNLWKKEDNAVVSTTETAVSYSERKGRLWNDLPPACFCRSFTSSVVWKSDSSHAGLPEAFSCGYHISCATGRTNNAFAWNWAWLQHTSRIPFWILFNANVVRRGAWSCLISALFTLSGVLTLADHPSAQLKVISYRLIL